MMQKKLPTKFFAEMLTIEIHLQTNEFRFEEIDKLIQYYAKAVEYYDLLRDPIKTYFLEKIQILLINKEALRVMIEQQELIKAQEARSSKLTTQTSTSSSSTSADSEVQVKKIDNKKLSLSTHDPVLGQIPLQANGFHNGTTISGCSTQRNKKPRQNTLVGKRGPERSRDFAFIMQLEKEKKNEKLILDALLNEYTSLNKANNKAVQKNLDTQAQALKERILKRKTQNFQAQSLNELKDRNTTGRWSIARGSSIEEGQENLLFSRGMFSSESSVQNNKIELNTITTSLLDLESIQNTCETETSEFSFSPLQIREEELAKTSYIDISDKEEKDIALFQKSDMRF